ncbi:GNAT family N-acetyltransferase [Enterococcus termitis]
MYQGFEPKFTAKLFAKDQAKDVAAVLGHYLCKTKPEQLLIAESDQEICGCLFLNEKGDTYHDLKRLGQSNFSLFEHLKVALLLTILSHSPKKEELYIDFIVVSSTFRSRGIGHELLAYCQSFAQKQQKRLTLYVSAANKRAMTLYQKEGFVPTKKTSSFLSQSIVKNKQWYFMQWHDPAQFPQYFL